SQASFEEFNLMWWESIGVVAGMLVLMLLVAIVPYVFDLPDAIAKYFNRRSRRSDAGLPSGDPDEAAARVLGESLRRAQLASKVAAQVTAAFWKADARNRRALAYLMAGMSEDGPVENADVLAMLGSLRA